MRDAEIAKKKIKQKVK